MSSSISSGSPGQRYRWLALTFAAGIAVALLIVIALKYSSKDSLAAPFASPQFTGQFDGDGIDVYFALTSRRDEVASVALEARVHSPSKVRPIQKRTLRKDRSAICRVLPRHQRFKNSLGRNSLGRRYPRWNSSA